jgi:hypothetical protein
MLGHSNGTLELFFEICQECLLILTASCSERCYHDRINLKKDSEIGTSVEFLEQIYLFNTSTV